MPDSAHDSIERSIELPAPRARVWRAFADTAELGAWFGVKLDSPAFVAGQRVRGNITYPGYEHLVFDALVEAVENGRLLALAWHPYPIDPAADYTGESPTRVRFSFEDTRGGTG